MGFFPEGTIDRTGGGTGNPLTGVVKTLSVKAKQAMYGAAKNGLLARHTWDGCAFNAAGKEIGQNEVASTNTAAQVFGMSPVHVERFITTWDYLGCNDEQANKYLIEALEASGLATPPGAHRGTRILRGFAFKSEATKFQEQLETGELTVDMIPGCEEAVQLLTACSS